MQGANVEDFKMCALLAFNEKEWSLFRHNLNRCRTMLWNCKIPTRSQIKRRAPDEAVCRARSGNARFRIYFNDVDAHQKSPDDAIAPGSEGFIQ